MASKAAEWAKGMAEAKRHERARPSLDLLTKHDGATIQFSVDDEGNLTVYFGGTRRVVSPGKALEAARWILATFGDGEGTR